MGVFFAEPWMLLTALAIPVLLLLHWTKTPPASLAVPSVGHILDTAPSLALRLRKALPALRVLALLALVLALGRPQYGLEATDIYRDGISIAMVVDISSSMGAKDLADADDDSNRLNVVKDTFRTFVLGDEKGLGGRESDLIGMITFARYADLLSPQTLDHRALLNMLAEVDITALTQEDGTAIGDAILYGVDRLRQSEGASRVMILLTDGSNNAGEADPLDAAVAARALGIKIYTIGAGRKGTAMMPVRNLTGGVEYRETQVFIDEHTLSQIATSTGGQYFRATDKEGLTAIYREIDRLEKAKNLAEHYQAPIELFPLFLITAIAFVLAEVGLANTRLQTVP